MSPLETAKKPRWYEDTRRERRATRAINGEFITDWLMVRRNGIEDPAGIIKTISKMQWTDSLDNDARSCHIFDLRAHWNLPEVASLDSRIFRAFGEAMQDYATENPFMMVSSDEGYNILRYDVGGSCLIHNDAWFAHDVERRVLSGLILLNDDFEGGELRWPRQGVTLKSEPGMVVLFPSGFSYPHEVTPVISGSRYSILTWMGVFKVPPPVKPDQLA
jgi:hypothetical protein